MGLCILSKNAITHLLKTPSQDILLACQASLLEQGAKGRPAMEANVCKSALGSRISTRRVYGGNFPPTSHQQSLVLHKILT